MKKIACYLFLILNSIVMSAQSTPILPEVEVSIKNAAIHLRTGLSHPPVDVKTLATYIDTLDHYLYKQPIAECALGFIAKLTLHTYYIKQDPTKVNFADLKTIANRIGSLSGFYDNYFVICMSALAEHQTKMNNYSEAIVSYQYAERALNKIVEENINMMPFLASIQAQLTKLYFLTKNYPKAVAMQEKVLAWMKQAIGEDSKEYGQGLSELCLLHKFNGNYNKAEDCYNQLLKLGEQGKLSEKIYLSALYDLASLKQEKSLFPEAITLFKQLLGKQPTGSIESARTFYDIAMCYRGLGEYKKGKIAADQSLEIAQKNPALNKDLLVSLMEWYKVSDQYYQAQKIADMLPSDTGESISSLSKQAYRNLLNGRYAFAKQLLNKARNLADEQIALKQSSLNFANELGDLMNAYMLLNDYKLAIYYGEHTLKLTTQELKDKHPITIATSILLASCYQFDGNYDRSLECFQEALVLIDKNSPEYTNLQIELVNLYFLMGKYDEAQNYYQKLLTTSMNAYQEWNVLFGLIGTLVSHVDILRMDGEEDKVGRMAADLLQYSLQLAEVSKVEYGIESEKNIYALNVLAMAYCINESYDKAKNCADECLQIIERLYPDNDIEKGRYIGELAPVYAEMKDYHTAIKLTEREIAMSKYPRETSIIEGDVAAYVLSESYLGIASYKKAQSSYTNLFELLKKKIKRNFSFMRENERERFFAVYRNQLFSAGKYLYLSKNYQNTFAGVVYNTALFSKSILLNSSVEWLNVVLKSNHPEFADLYMEMRSLRNLCENTDAPIESSVRDSLKKKADALETHLVKKSVEYKNYMRYLDITWQDIQKKLENGEVAIEFINFDVDKDSSSVYAALILRKEWSVPRMIPLINAKDLNELQVGNCTVKDALKLEKNKVDINNIYKSESLYQVIWKPLESVLKPGDCIYFSPAGIFNLIAIEYLSDTDLIPINQKYTLFRCSSTRILLQEKMKNQYHSAVIYGGLDYYPNDQEMIAQSKKYPKKPYGIHNPDHSQISGQTIPSLSGQEARLVAQLFRDKNIDNQLYMGTGGNEESFKALSGKSPSIIHLSTHGFYRQNRNNFDNESVSLKIQKRVNDGSLDNSILLFAGAGSYSKETFTNEVEDGVLSAKEIADMNLRDTELVVTSACQTGLGEVSGEGVYGILRGFKKAGVRSLITTLWEVDEHATEIMFTQFYNNLLAGQDMHIAFLNAQNSVKKGSYEVIDNGSLNKKGQRISRKRTVHLNIPIYWAGFILIDGIN